MPALSCRTSGATGVETRLGCGRDPDLVVTDNPGFTVDKNQLNVAFTRVRDGFVIVGNTMAISWLTAGHKRKRGGLLPEMLEAIRKKAYEVNVGNTGLGAANANIRAITLTRLAINHSLDVSTKEL